MDDNQKSKADISFKLKKKEAEYMKINAELQEKTAHLVKEAEDIIRNTDEDSPTVNCKSSGGGLSESIDVSLDIKRTVERLEETFKNDVPVQLDDAQQVIPLVAEELGSEAMVRFLKAKLHVTKEEVEKLNKSVSEMEKNYLVSQNEVKSLLQQNMKMEKLQQSLQLNVTKYQQLADNLQMKCDGLEGQMFTLKKEMENERSSQKKIAQSHSGIEVRLNRALEEVEKYKGLCHKMKTDSKDATKQEKKLIESLEAQNKLLERQKKELLIAFHKQMKFVDILKKQKIHLEAARMLAFTEEEFIKVLEWESS